MHETVENALSLYLCVFSGAGLAFYTAHIAHNTVQRRQTVVLGCACILLRAAAAALIPGGDGSGGSAVRLSVLLASEAALAAVLCGRARLKALYAVFSWNAVFELSFFISYTIVYASGPLYSAISDNMLNTAVDDPEGFMRTLQYAAFMVQALMLTALTVLQVMSCRYISSCMCRGRLTGVEFRLLTLPCAVSLILVVLLRTLMVTADNGIPGLLHDRYPASAFLIPAICAAALLSVVYSAKTYSDMCAMAEAQRNVLIANEQIRALKEQVIESERRADHTRKIQHDLRNTLTVIQGLADSAPGTGTLHSYITELTKDMADLGQQFNTGNPVADILLDAKYRSIQSTAPDIRFDTDSLFLPYECSISDYDIGIILGNALDNALRAVCMQSSGPRFISLRSVMHGDALALYIENSCDETGYSTNRLGLPVSTSGAGHGIGLANIRDIAEKYSGVMDWKLSGGVFLLAVILKTELNAAE